MTRDDSIERFLAAVSDRCDADWAELDRTSSSPADRALVRNLRALRTIADHGAPLTSADLDAPKGTWAHLTLLEKVGEGSYGEVHRAWDPKLSIDVALKLIPRRSPRPRKRCAKGDSSHASATRTWRACTAWIIGTASWGSGRSTSRA